MSMFDSREYTYSKSNQAPAARWMSRQQHCDLPLSYNRRACVLSAIDIAHSRKEGFDPLLGAWIGAREWCNNKVNLVKYKWPRRKRRHEGNSIDRLLRCIRKTLTLRYMARYTLTWYLCCMWEGLREVRSEGEGRKNHKKRKGKEREAKSKRLLKNGSQTKLN